MTLISDPTDTRALPPSESTGSKIKKALGPIGVIGVVILKFIGKIKFILPILLKTGGSMILMIGVYASIWGWKWAVGLSCFCSCTSADICWSRRNSAWP
jgi:hypothetical protein